MNAPVHTLTELFRQLGLPDDERGIMRFIVDHRLPDPAVSLADAPFWKASQAAFVRDELACDADWAEIVDILDVLLRGPKAGDPRAGGTITRTSAGARSRGSRRPRRAAARNLAGPAM
jgi:hypothetical protein